MEQSHGLTLNEEALQQVPEVKRPIFIYEWLRFLDKSLGCAKKSDVKECQKKLVEQLMAQLVGGSPGPPTRQLLAQCMATLFSVGDTFLLFDTINKCNDLLKTKDDSPTFLPCRLAATVVVGAMYQVRDHPAVSLEVPFYHLIQSKYQFYMIAVISNTDVLKVEWLEYWVTLSCIVMSSFCSPA